MSDYAGGAAEMALGIGTASRGYRCTTCHLRFATKADRTEHAAGPVHRRYCRPLERLRQLGYVREGRNVWGRPNAPRTKPKRRRASR